MLRRFAALAASLAAATAFAQLVTDPEWKEAAVPPPPALRTEGLVAVDVGSSALRFGIDPDSVAVGPDRVVRFVIVAKSSTGAMNAMYEGVLCDRDEYRMYARHTGQSWQPVEMDWKSLKEGAGALHARAAARAGLCLGHSPSGTPDQIVRNLRSGYDTRFGGSGAP